MIPRSFFLLLILTSLSSGCVLTRGGHRIRFHSPRCQSSQPPCEEEPYTPRESVEQGRNGDVEYSPRRLQPAPGAPIPPAPPSAEQAPDPEMEDSFPVPPAARFERPTRGQHSQRGPISESEERSLPDDAPVAVVQTPPTWTVGFREYLDRVRSR